MKRRIPVALLSAAVVIAMSAFIGGSFAAPLSNVPLGLLSSNATAPVKVQYACGWTYSCNNIGSGGAGSVQIYGPANVYTNTDVDVKQVETWRVPDGAWAWNGQGDYQNWRGWGCSGHACDERCGAFCWFNRIRNGYCGHGCDAYREHVMFQPINGNLRPYVYRSDGDYGYGSGYGSGGAPGGYGYGSGQASGGYGYGSGQASGGYGYGNGPAPAGYGSGQEGYSQTSVQEGYDSSSSNGGYSQNAPQDSYGAPTPNGERFIDRLRRYFYGRPRREPYRDTAAVRDNRAIVRDNGGVRYERPSNDLVPLRRFNGPKYPPNSDGGPKSYGEPK